MESVWKFFNLAVSEIRTTWAVLHSLPFEDRVLAVLFILLTFSVLFLAVQLFVPSVWRKIFERHVGPSSPPKQVSATSSIDPHRRIRDYVRRLYTAARLRGIGWLPFKLLLWLMFLVFLVKVIMQPIHWMLGFHIPTMYMIAAVFLLAVAAVIASYFSEAKRRKKKGLQPVPVLRFAGHFSMPTFLITGLAAIDELPSLIWEAWTWIYQTML